MLQINSHHSDIAVDIYSMICHLQTLYLSLAFSLSLFCYIYLACSLIKHQNKDKQDDTDWLLQNYYFVIVISSMDVNMKFPHKADMQSEEAPRGSSSTPPGGPRGFHKNFIMYICTKSSLFVSLTQAAAAHEN